MILLDTNAVIFLLAAHPRGRALAVHAGRLAVSPIAILELCLLAERGRLHFPAGDPAATVRRDSRWTIDDPPLDGVIAQAAHLAWARDPFDRLIAAHALARGWPLATSEPTLLARLPSTIAI